MSLRPVMHFRDASQTEHGALLAAIAFGKSEALREGRPAGDEPESRVRVKHQAAARRCGRAALYIAALLAICLAYAGAMVCDAACQASAVSTLASGLDGFRVAAGMAQASAAHGRSAARDAGPCVAATDCNMCLPNVLQVATTPRGVDVVAGMAEPSEADEPTNATVVEAPAVQSPTPAPDARETDSTGNNDDDAHVVDLASAAAATQAGVPDTAASTGSDATGDASAIAHASPSPVPSSPVIHDAPALVELEQRWDDVALAPAATPAAASASVAPAALVTTQASPATPASVQHAATPSAPSAAPAADDELYWAPALAATPSAAPAVNTPHATRVPASAASGLGALPATLSGVPTAVLVGAGAVVVAIGAAITAAVVCCKPTVAPDHQPAAVTEAAPAGADNNTDDNAVGAYKDTEETAPLAVSDSLAPAHDDHDSDNDDGEQPDAEDSDSIASPSGAARAAKLKRKHKRVATTVRS